MGTTGLTAQALGAQDNREIAGHLLRALLVAALGGVLLVALQWPIREAALWLTGGSAEVVRLAAVYFDIRIWAAPAGLVNFALLGWFIGIGRAGLAFVIQIALNFANMALAVVLVLGAGFAVEGVGIAALLAEWAAAVGGLWVAARTARSMGAYAPKADAIDRAKLRRSLVINTDITIRSLGNFAALTFFTAQGAAAGDVTLAANALLVSIKNIMIYLLDGFAFAVEALVGRAIGARDRPQFWRAVRLTTVWAAVFAMLVGGIIWVAGEWLIALSAKSDAVRGAAGAFLLWAALSPILGVWCFQLDGIFIGATRTRDMRNGAIASTGWFVLSAWLLTDAHGNDGLWLAFIGFVVARAAALGVRYPALRRAVGT